MTHDDPVTTDPEHYATVFENEYVRVLEYHDVPGDKTSPHEHPNSVMVTLSGFQRLLTIGDDERRVQVPAGKVVWLPAQRHTGENVGDTNTHTILVELKGDAAGSALAGADALGPVMP